MKKYNKKIDLAYEEALGQDSETNLDEVFDRIFIKMIKVNNRWEEFMSSSFNLKQYQFACWKKSKFIELLTEWLYSD